MEFDLEFDLDFSPTCVLRKEGSKIKVDCGYRIGPSLEKERERDKEADLLMRTTAAMFEELDPAYPRRPVLTPDATPQERVEVEHTYHQQQHTWLHKMASSTGESSD